MINIDRLKDIIVSNKSFILNEIGRIIARDIAFPARGLKKVCVLYGIRRSGKSYILFDLFKRYTQNSLYIDFEDERLEGFRLEDFERLKEAFFELNPHLISAKTVIFLLDEVQNVAGWEKFVRRVTERENIKVFITGSSSKVMPREIHTSLRGRSWSVEVAPFSFKEFAVAKDIGINDKDFIYGPKKALARNCFSEYLRFGAFPETTFLKSAYEKRKVLKEYLEAMFFKDLVERFDLTNIHLLDALRDKLFSSFSLKYSLTSFCRQYKDRFPFSKDSVFAYFKHFLESMLIFEAKKFSESSYQRQRNPAKIYLVDVGLAKKVASSDTGRILENIVFLELRKQAEEVFYFENKGECDFIVKNQQHFSCYQVVWELNEKTRPREASGLLEACRYLKVKTGTILTLDHEGQERLEGITISIKPVWKWLLGK